MTKSKEPEIAQLDVTLTIRMTTADEELLTEITRSHKLAKRGAVAREAMRRGLASLRAEVGGK
jgi:hypothetical protein